MMLARDRQDRVHIAWLPVKMNRDQGPGARSDGGFDQIRIDIEAGVAHIHQNRTRSERGNRESRRDKGVRGHQDFVPWFDPENFESQPNRIKSAADTDHLFGSEILAEFFLEVLNLPAQDEITSGEHAGNGRLYLGSNRRVLRLQIDKWNLHTLYFRSPKLKR